MNKNIGSILFLLSGLSIKISILKNSRYNIEYKYTLLKKGMPATFTYVCEFCLENGSATLELGICIFLKAMLFYKF